MSQENVKIVRRLIEAHTRNDLDAVYSFYDPDIEWDVTRTGGPVVGADDVLRGHAGVRTWFAGGRSLSAPSSTTSES